MPRKADLSITPEKDEPLSREIGSLGYSAITLNGLIGAGIFALPGVAAHALGNFSPWMFLICGALILTIVLSFARAASFFSSTGGPTVYATHAFGPFVGFQAGWLMTLSRVASLAANTLLLVTYAGWLWAPLTDGLPRKAAVVIVLLGLTGLNIIGVRKGMLTVYILTFFKLIPLSLLIIIGLAHVNPGLLLDAGLPAPQGLGETILTLMYAFIGFEGAVVPAGEGRNPKRDIPKALIMTVLVVALVYFLIQFVSISVYPELASGVSETPLADVAFALMGTAGATMLSLGAVFSVGGNNSAAILSAPRMIYSMARDNTLPSWFGEIHKDYRTPANSILFFGLVALVLALSDSFAWLAVMSTLVRMLVYIIVIVSLPVLQKRRGETEDQFRLPGAYTIPAIALLICLWLITEAHATAWYTTAAFAAVGTALYVWKSRKAD